MAFYILWLKRVLFSTKAVFQFSSLFSLFSLILAVAVLTVAVMAANGFSSGLEKILIDKQGHLRIKSDSLVLKDDLWSEVSDYKDFFDKSVFFLSFSALVVQERSFKGVIFEAIEDEKLKSLSFVKNRIIEGSLDFSSPFVVLGSELAKELGVSIGSDVSVIVSKGSDFSKKQVQFKVAGLIDFGRYEFNSFFALMPLSSSGLLDFNQVSGLSLWLKNKSQTSGLKKELLQVLPPHYFVQSWEDSDRAFLTAITADKKIIFFVLLILIVSAGFNVSSSVFIQVFKRTKEINILKTMGIKKTAIRNLFFLNGFILGIFGTILGILLGLLVGSLLIFLQNHWHFIPTQPHQNNKMAWTQISELAWTWSFSDILQIFLISLFMVVLSSILPARRAYKMNVKRGLSYD